MMRRWLLILVLSMTMNKIIKLIVLFVGISMAGCVSANTNENDEITQYTVGGGISGDAALNLWEVKKILDNKLKISKAESVDTSKLQRDIRLKQIRITANKLGIALGMNAYIQSVNSYIRTPRVQKMLDRSYPFERFLFKANYMPPVIDYQENTISVNRQRTILRKVKFIFKKIKGAKVVTTTPSWRSYFYAFKAQGLKKIDLEKHLNIVTSPVFQSELDTWKFKLDEGYKTGMDYIESNFQIKINEMDRDFKGYLLFYILQDQGIIRPVVIEREHRDYILKKNELRIGDDVFEILDATFQINGYLKKIKEYKRALKMQNENRPKSWIERDLDSRKQ